MKKVKLSDTLNLFATYRKTNNVKILDKALKMSTEICVGSTYSHDDKISIIQEILALASTEEQNEIKKKQENKLSKEPKPELELEVRSTNLRTMCTDYVNRWRDGLLHLDGVDGDNMISLLRRVIKIQQLSVIDRVNIAVHFYNAAKYHVCYPCFADLAEDQLLPLESRLECLKFLFSSGEEEERNITKKVLLNIISDERYSCELRYSAIRSYIPNTGIRTVSNLRKLMVPYEEEFVCVLQTAFFNNEKNDVRFRLLSGQHLLQMNDKCVEQHTKSQITEKLFTIGDCQDHTENTRADALSIILRLSDHSSQVKAREKISDIGNKSSRVLFKTVYDNSQNIHDESINQSIISYLEKTVESTTDMKIYSLAETIGRISSYVGNMFPVTIDEDINAKKRRSIANSIARIKNDTATFTKYGITSSEVMCHTYSRIHSGEFDGDTIKLLMERLIDELIDMDDTCSDGANRFVNVFSGYDETIKISWEDQIKANIFGRINAKIRACDNANLQATLTFGMMEDADEEDRKVYIKFVIDNFDEIERELYSEFVKDGHISENVFIEHMKNIRSQIV